MIETAHRFLKTGDPVDWCHPRWSRFTKLYYGTKDPVLDKVEQISFKGAEKPGRPWVSGPLERMDRTISSSWHRQNSSLLR
jgi:hypothetical protein